MKYIMLSTENRVVEIIPEFNPIFPDVPITERYTKEFVAGLIEVADEVEVDEGWIYDFISGTFTEYVESDEPIVPTTDASWDDMANAITEGVNDI